MMSVMAIIVTQLRIIEYHNVKVNATIQWTFVIVYSFIIHTRNLTFFLVPYFYKLFHHGRIERSSNHILL